MSEVKLLGFNDGADIDKNLLISSANRALRELYNHRTITKTVKFSARGLVPTIYYDEIVCKNGNPISLSAVGKCYSFRLCGKGYYSINDGSETIVKQFDTGPESELVRGFITFGGTIKFWGSFSFSIYDFSVYDERLSPDITDIPDCVSTTEYDIRKIYGDFMAFVSPATDKNGKVIDGCTLHDGRLKISSRYRGEIHLTYRRLPQTIVSANPGSTEKDIDIPSEYLYLFPLLVASYVWLDNDEKKANYYKSRYDECLKLIDSSYYDELDTAYIDTNGWA